MVTPIEKTEWTAGSIIAEIMPEYSRSIYSKERYVGGKDEWNTAVNEWDLYCNHLDAWIETKQ